MSRQSNGYNREYNKNYDNRKDRDFSSVLSMNKHIVDYIFSTIDISKFNYKILKYENELELLIKQKYYLSANFSGKSSLLVFTKSEDKFCSYIVERKILGYSNANIRYDKIKLLPASVRLDNSIYNGTIFDGTFIINKKTNTRTFIITDVYIFRGEHMVDYDLKTKLDKVTKYINITLSKPKNINKYFINLTVNELYCPTKIEDLKVIMQKCTDIDFHGVVFYPEKSGTKLIFTNIDFDETEERKLDVNKELEEKQESFVLEENKQDVNKENKKEKLTRFISKIETDIFEILELRKTNNPDVYQVFCSEKFVENNVNKIKLIKLGIALIPDIETSKLCRNILDTKSNGRSLFKCKFDEKREKWIPVEIANNAKLPSDKKTIQEKIDFIYELSE